MAEAPATAPMEEETLPEECMDTRRFQDEHKFPATGTGKTTMLKILRKMPGKAHKEILASLPIGTDSVKGTALMKLLDTNKALERAILDYRCEAVKTFNAECRAAEAEAVDEAVAAKETIDDGPLPYPPTGRSAKVVKGVMRERDDLLDVARSRFGDDLEGETSLAHVLANKLMASEALEDKKLIEEIYAHRDARAKAHRETLSSAGGRIGRDGRTLGSAAAPTLRAGAVSWTDNIGKNATAALAAALQPLDETSPPSDTAAWDASAATVSSAAGRTYTGMQCYARASKKNMLRTKVSALYVYAPKGKGWAPRKPSLEGLDAKVKRGEAARRDLEKLEPKRLYSLAKMVYNHGLCEIRRDKDALIEALVESNMPAVNPQKHGADGFESASSKRFRRAFEGDALRRSNVRRSLEASQRLLAPPSEERGRGGAAVATSVRATRARLDRKNVLTLCVEEFSLAPDQAPPTRAMPLLHRYFCEPAFEPRVGYDPVQHCTCCRRYYIDVGGKVCCEHDWISRGGLVSIRNNGACESRRVSFLGAF